MKKFRPKVTETPNGRFRTVVRITSHGKSVPKTITADTEWETIKLAIELKEANVTCPERELTVGDAIDSYIDKRRGRIQPTTLLNYEEIRRNKLQSIMAIKLRSLKTEQVQWAIDEDSKRLSYKSINNALGLLKSTLKYFNISVDWNDLSNPKKVHTQKYLPEFMEIYKIIKGTDSELPVLLASWLSLRIGEVIALKFKDVDKKHGVIHVRRTIIHTKDGYVERESCKTLGSTRDIKLPDYICKLIDAVPHENDSDFIIPKSRKAVYSKFKRLINKHNIDMSFHELRHLNASIMLSLGIPDKYAMERGGWSTDNVLKSVYQQTLKSERENVNNKIDDYFIKMIADSNDLK